MSWRANFFFCSAHLQPTLERKGPFVDGRIRYVEGGDRAELILRATQRPRPIWPIRMRVFARRKIKGWK